MAHREDGSGLSEIGCGLREGGILDSLVCIQCVYCCGMGIGI